jgi:HAE1 family hydrophobic/amphiphilic exporter-1
VKTAVVKNLGVGIEDYEFRQSGQSLRTQYGIFDWFSTATVGRNHTEQPVASQFLSSSRTVDVVNFGVSQLIPTGGTYGVTFDNSKTEQVGGGTFVNPSLDTSFGLSFDQPLLRNFGVDITRRGVNIARNTLGISREQFRTVLMDTAVSVEQAYLDLVYARQQVDVVKEAVFLARDQARITQIRIDVGASAPLDILQPRVQIATSEEQLILAVAAVRDAEDRLRALMNLDPAEWDRPIIPTDPVRYEAMNIDPEAAVARAFELRPELRQSALTIDTRRIQETFARNQVLPALDLRLTYGAAGQAGTFFDSDPITNQPIIVDKTRFGSALEQLGRSDFPSWSFGVNVGIPVTNIGARAEARRARLDLQQSRLEESQTRQNVALQVRQTLRDIDTAGRSIAATRAAREAAEQNLEAERRRYENGMTTNFQVLQVQQQLSDTRVREIQALVGYNKAVSAYHRAVGDLLEVRNIAVEEPTEDVKEPRMFTYFNRYNWLNYQSYSKPVEGDVDNNTKRQ